MRLGHCFGDKTQVSFAKKMLNNNTKTSQKNQFSNLKQKTIALWRWHDENYNFSVIAPLSFHVSRAMQFKSFIGLSLNFERIHYYLGVKDD